MKLFFATTAALLMGAAPIQACGIYSSCNNSHSLDMIMDSILDDLGKGDAERAAERRHRELMRELRRQRTY